ncbi:Dyp-type peroxidase [Endozoicomonas atrinae]|uniref:Dyp-type peroxidase n=1 Tax=Endozoicomonas atrinae TaxID=1333660 RepID=UPI000825EEAC|nr:Dyp-type peroxidase [Endozoicomonas atrinae]
MPTPQSGITPDANSDAHFLVLTIKESTSGSLSHIRQTLSGIPELTQSLSSQYPDARLSSTISIGSDAWEQLYSSRKPAALRPFMAVKDGDREAPATAGDLFLHIRSDRKDVNYILMSQLLRQLGSTVQIQEDVSGFRYLDSRDLTGFVDGTENPEGDNRAAVAIVGDEDSSFAGGSYIHTQRYVHHLKEWEQCPLKDQETIIGRTKEDNIEFSSEEKAPIAHIKRVNLKDEHGKSMEILRHSMPYGDARESGLFFIAYGKTPKHFNLMLKAMIKADAHGHYDHLMNFSTAVTGCAFFAPSIEFLKENR